MANFSNYLKAVLYPDSILEYGKNIEKRSCHTVQYFTYKCQRSRNEAGMPYGTTVPSEMVFTIKLETPNDGRVFYERMKSNELFDYTFIFNATFNPLNRLASSDDVMVAKGYVVDVKEDYDTKVLEDGSMNQMLMQVRLLLSSITYAGQEDNHKLLEITKY